MGREAPLGKSDLLDIITTCSIQHQLALHAMIMNWSDRPRVITLDMASCSLVYHRAHNCKVKSRYTVSAQELKLQLQLQEQLQVLAIVVASCVPWIRICMQVISGGPTSAS